MNAGSFVSLTPTEGNITQTVSALTGIGHSTISEVDEYICDNNQPQIEEGGADDLVCYVNFAFSAYLPVFCDAEDSSFSLQLLRANGSTRPAWLKFNTTTLQISGIPAASDAGILQLMYVGTDSGGKSGVTFFEINVNFKPIKNKEIPVIET